MMGLFLGWFSKKNGVAMDYCESLYSKKRRLKRAKDEGDTREASFIEYDIKILGKLCRHGSMSGYFDRIIKRISRDRWVSPVEVRMIFDTAMRKFCCGNTGIVMSRSTYHRVERFGCIRGEPPFAIGQLNEAGKRAVTNLIKKEDKLRAAGAEQYPGLFEAKLLEVVVKHKRRRYEYINVW